MKISKILLLLTIFFSIIGLVSADYKEISCSTSKSFTDNNCNQCFDGETKSAGDNIGLMTDLWVNDSDKDKILYKEEQEMPKMINLNSSRVTWKQNPSSEGFWEYTKEFDNTYSEDEDGYILKAGKKIVWLKSKLGYAYTLEKNNVEKNGNIGLLVYTIITHNIMSEGDITIDSTEHKECVLFKSGESTKKVTSVTPSKKVTPVKKLPETGPEHILLVLLALILGFGLLKFRKRV